MDTYSLERWALERHNSMVRTAEERERLDGWHSQPTLARMLAVNLRTWADRLDGRTTITVVSGSR